MDSFPVNASWNFTDARVLTVVAFIHAINSFISFICHLFGHVCCWSHVAYAFSYLTTQLGTAPVTRPMDVTAFAPNNSGPHTLAVRLDALDQHMPFASIPRV